MPELARSRLDYRYARLDKARERARRAVGCRGAMFPWRSARPGEEETPPWQCNPMSGRWMADHTRLQRYIGSAVAYDAWQLYLAAADKALLAGPVGELVIEVACFWASLAQFDASRQRYLICGVIGPDEYHNSYPDAAEPGLNNNAYTNLMGPVRSTSHLLPRQTLQQLLECLGYRHDTACTRHTIAYHLARITHESSLSKVVCAGALAGIDSKASWTYYQQAPGHRSGFARQQWHP
nr:hypothetical protein [Stutzerimonas stutzeri]